MTNLANTDHIVSARSSIAAAGTFAALRQLWRNWKARRAVTRLDEFDDYMLRDIGVTRLDVRWASELPLSSNAALELEKRSLRRRTGNLRD